MSGTSTARRFRLRDGITYIKNGFASLSTASMALFQLTTSFWSSECTQAYEIQRLVLSGSGFLCLYACIPFLSLLFPASVMESFPVLQNLSSTMIHSIQLSMMFAGVSSMLSDSRLGQVWSFVTENTGNSAGFGASIRSRVTSLLTNRWRPLLNANENMGSLGLIRDPYSYSRQPGIIPYALPTMAPSSSSFISASQSNLIIGYQGLVLLTAWFMSFFLQPLVLMTDTIYWSRLAVESINTCNDPTEEFIMKAIIILVSLLLFLTYALINGAIFLMQANEHWVLAASLILGILVTIYILMSENGIITEAAVSVWYVSFACLRGLTAMQPSILNACVQLSRGTDKTGVSAGSVLEGFMFFPRSKLHEYNLSLEYVQFSILLVSIGLTVYTAFRGPVVILKLVDQTDSSIDEITSSSTFKAARAILVILACTFHVLVFFRLVFIPWQLGLGPEVIVTLATLGLINSFTDGVTI